MFCGKNASEANELVLIVSCVLTNHWSCAKEVCQGRSQWMNNDAQQHKENIIQNLNSFF